MAWILNEWVIGEKGEWDRPLDAMCLHNVRLGDDAIDRVRLRDDYICVYTTDLIIAIPTDLSPRKMYLKVFQKVR